MSAGEIYNCGDDRQLFLAQIEERLGDPIDYSAEAGLRRDHRNR